MSDVDINDLWQECEELQAQVNLMREAIENRDRTIFELETIMISGCEELWDKYIKDKEGAPMSEELPKRTQGKIRARLVYKGRSVPAPAEYNCASCEELQAEVERLRELIKHVAWSSFQEREIDGKRTVVVDLAPFQWDKIQEESRR